MKKNPLFVLLCSFALLLFACKKEDTAPAPPTTDSRDAFVGTYHLNYGGNCGSGTATLIVKKGDGFNQLLFTDPGMANYPVQLDGNNFTIVPYTQPTVVQGVTISVNISGYGRFDSNTIKYTETSQYTSLGYTCTNQATGTK